MFAVVGIPILYFFFKESISDIVSQVNSNCEYYAKSNDTSSIFFFIVVEVLFAWIPMPGWTYISILIPYYMKTFMKPFLIILSGNYIGGISIFLFVRYYGRSWVLQKYGKTIIYRIFNNEVKTSPWTISVISNMLLLPHSVKNTVLPLTSMTFV